MSKKFLIAAIIVMGLCSCKEQKESNANILEKSKPNVLVILTDQWRAQATGYSGDQNVKTPHLDSLSAQSVNFQNAVSGMPVCSPFRASLLTGQRPLTHGVFMNDVQLDTAAVTIGKVFANAGYSTGYIGKWHMDGRGRHQFIPPSRRQGFEFWKANECTHDYNHSPYFDNDSIRKFWKGYDTFEQTDEAIGYFDAQKTSENPFMMVLSYGTPHAPYHTAPESYRKRFNPEDIKLRKNVPDSLKEQVKKDLAGYYAHIVAIDDMIGKLKSNLKKNGQLENTIIVFTSDHGDLLGSHGSYKKQQPYEESVRVPMLYYIPKQFQFQIQTGSRNAIMNSEDIMPTLLGLCDISIPESVEGINYKPYLEGKEDHLGNETLITCVQPFGQWNRVQHNAREYRGLVTQKYTYTRDLNGPWMLFDNEKDPYQLNNLIDDPEHAKIKKDLDSRLIEKLKETGDEFRPGMEYIKKWNYPVDDTETVPYTA
jgi:arylsulfatase A-like enzyme